MEEEVLHIPITLQKLERADPSSKDSSTQRPRSHYGMVYFPQGTTANQASEYIASRQSKVTGATGIWLLLIKSEDGSESDADGGFVRVRDSKHELKDGNQYIALFYNGPDIFLIKP